MKLILCLVPFLFVGSFVQAQFGCKVINRVVDCSNLGLTTVPDFSALPNAASITEIDLKNNDLITIPSHAFKAVHPRILNLENNKLASIADGGFNNLYESLLTLNVKGNNLTFMPTEMGGLNKIQSLDIKNNPASRVDLDVRSDNVFRQIGDTLLEFHFGSNNYATWPNVALTHFPKLKTLDFEGGVLNYIPYNGFHGFEHTLKKLYISKTQIRQVPIGISTLQQLEELHFDDNTLVGNSGIMEQAFATTSHNASPLKILSLQNDGLTRFPAVLRNLNSLQELHMDRNRLWYVADDAVHLLQQTVTKMGLSGCSLDRIPQALLQLQGLTELDVSNNNIQSIERYDMSNHGAISLLNVSSNPLAYISSEAFKNLPRLGTLDFSKTSMTEIPEAIKHMGALRHLNLIDCNIECTCDLTWINSTLRTTIDYQGTCETIEKPINSYIKERVPNCPLR